MKNCTNSQADLLRLCPVVSTTMPFNFICPEHPKQVHLAIPRADDVLVKWFDVITQCEEKTTYTKADATKHLLNHDWLVVQNPKIIQK